MSIDERSSREAGVKTHVRTDELIDLATMPGTLGTTEGANHPPARAHIAFTWARNGQDHVTNSERCGVTDFGDGECCLLQLEHGQRGGNHATIWQTNADLLV